MQTLAQIIDTAIKAPYQLEVTDNYGHVQVVARGTQVDLDELLHCIQPSLAPRLRPNPLFGMTTDTAARTLQNN